MAAFGKTKQGICVAAVASVMIVGPGASSAVGQTMPRSYEKIRFEKLDFKVDDKIPLRDLLPPAPKAVAPEPSAGNDLAGVPEVQLEETLIVKTLKPDKKLSDAENSKREIALEAAIRKSMLRTAHQIAKINYLNLKKRDSFMDALLENRPDLAGLPFVMGDACRLQKSERADFKSEMDLMRARLNDSVETLAALVGESNRAIDRLKKNGSPAQIKEAEQLLAEKERGGMKRFWHDDDEHIKERLKEKTTADRERFRVAAFRQILGQNQSELVPRLAALGQSAEKEATQALAQMAVFATDEEARQAAVAALQKLPADPATAVLLKGLRYPWPSVAQNSADAVVQLKRGDLIPELIKMLEEPDPRAPVMDTDKKAPVVRELVRINHHRNCLLCHPPGNTPDVLRIKSSDTTWSKAENGVQSTFLEGNPDFDPEVLVAPVPTPGAPIVPSVYYSRSAPDIVVRADATYLRQDFSMLLKVADAEPWPETQRFDYLVRTRVLTENEAATYQKAFGGNGPTPYRQAALSALRRLTGKDAGASAEQWRSALGL